MYLFLFTHLSPNLGKRPENLSKFSNNSAILCFFNGAFSLHFFYSHFVPDSNDEVGKPEQYSNEVPTKLRTLNNMCRQYIEEGRAETCVPLCKKALNDVEREFGHEHPDVATILCILANVYKYVTSFLNACNVGC